MEDKRLTGFDYVWKRLTTPLIRRVCFPAYTRISFKDGRKFVVDFSGRWVEQRKLDKTV